MKGVTPTRAAARVSGGETFGERVDAVADRSETWTVGERAIGLREVERTLVAVLAEREWRTGLQGRGRVRIERPVRLEFGTG